MTKQPTTAGQLAVGQHVEYIGRSYFPTRTIKRFAVQGEITELCRGTEDRNVVHISILSSDGQTHYARAMFHPLGNLRFQDGESIRVLREAPQQREIAAC